MQQYELRWPTIQEFRNYLRSLKQEDPAAPFCRRGHCPIAQWMADTLELPKNARVGVTDSRAIAYWGSFANSTPELRTPPAWIKKFIARIDDEEIRMSNNSWRKIPVATALQVLDQINKETK